MARRTGWVVLFFFALVPGLAVAFGQAAGQSSPQTNQVAAAVAAVVNPVMPSDPNAAMLLAARVNGLASPDMKPWHLKANYQTFDADGKPEDQGVFEEWWAGPEKYKISYASAGFNQVRYETGTGLLMTGDDAAPSLAEAMIENLLAHPIPEPREIKAENYVAHNAKDGSVALTCLREESKRPINPVYCFQGDSSAVRLEDLRDGNMVFFNDIVSMNDRYVSKQIDVKYANSPLLQLQVTTLEPLVKIDDSVLAPPAGAVTALLPPQFEPPGGVHLISAGKDFKPPPIAMAAHVHGTVILAVTVSTKGDVSDVRVISGPAMLRQAAIDSVKAYRFTPYKVKGQPVAIEILVTVGFERSR